MENVNTIPMSILEQLKKVAVETEKSYADLVGQYLQEKLLYRLSVSTYRDRFLLKGDPLIFSLTMGSVKPSVEIVLSAKQMTNDINLVKRAFREICTINVPEDGIDFLVDELDFTTEKEDIFITIPVTLAQTKTYIKVRINFGDCQILNPKTIAFPSILEMDPPKILAYPTELVFAEKFEAMYRLPGLESRMMDFYEVYMLSNSQNVEGRVLQEAMMLTFDRHRTILEKDPALFSKQFYLDMEKTKQWQAFVGHQSLEFEEVIKRLQSLYMPIYNAIVEEDEFFKNWDNEIGDWK